MDATAPPPDRAVVPGGRGAGRRLAACALTTGALARWLLTVPGTAGWRLPLAAGLLGGLAAAISGWATGACLLVGAARSDRRPGRLARRALRWWAPRGLLVAGALPVLLGTRPAAAALPAAAGVTWAAPPAVGVAPASRASRRPTPRPLPSGVPVPGWLAPAPAQPVTVPAPVVAPAPADAPPLPSGLPAPDRLVPANIGVWPQSAPSSAQSAGAPGAPTAVPGAAGAPPPHGWAEPVNPSTGAPTTTTTGDGSPRRGPSGPVALPGPSESPSHAAVPPARGSRATADGHRGPATLTVRRGDTLWSLARRWLAAHRQRSTDRAVAAAWPRWWQRNAVVIGPDPDLLYPGMVLTPPGP